MQPDEASERLRALLRDAAADGVQSVRQLGLAPEAQVARAWRVLGRRRRDDEPSVFPDRGTLAQLHGDPGLEALAVSLQHDGHELSWWWWASDGRDLGPLLRAGFGGDMVVEGERPRGPAGIEAVAIGRPAVPEPDAAWPGVDRLVEALPTSRWALLVYATPMRPREVDQELEGLRDQLVRIRRSPESLRATPPLDVLAERIEQVLAHRERHRSTGLWSTTTVLLAEDRATLQVAAAALGGAHPLPEDVPDPLRVRPTRTGATESPVTSGVGSAELARMLVTCQGLAGVPPSP